MYHDLIFIASLILAYCIICSLVYWFHWKTHSFLFMSVLNKLPTSSLVSSFFVVAFYLDVFFIDSSTPSLFFIPMCALIQNISYKLKLLGCVELLSDWNMLSEFDIIANFLVLIILSYFNTSFVVMALAKQIDASGCNLNYLKNPVFSWIKAYMVLCSCNLDSFSIQLLIVISLSIIKWKNIVCKSYKIIIVSFVGDDCSKFIFII